jgi:hypothetical protein
MTHDQSVSQPRGEDVQVRYRLIRSFKGAVIYPVSGHDGGQPELTAGIILRLETGPDAIIKLLGIRLAELLAEMAKAAPACPKTEERDRISRRVEAQEFDEADFGAFQTHPINIYQTEIPQSHSDAGVLLPSHFLRDLHLIVTPDHFALGCTFCDDGRAIFGLPAELVPFFLEDMRMVHDHLVSGRLQ